MPPTPMPVGTDDDTSGSVWAATSMCKPPRSLWFWCGLQDPCVPKSEQSVRVWREAGHAR
eukprot:1138190-Pelagomonas_calceolata.AAC.3